MAKSLSASSLGGLPIQIDATARDYASIRQELIELAARLTPEWTDFYEADPGVVILENMAYVGDVLSYTLDRIQNEAYLLTAQERASVIHLLRLINYELSPGAAASVPVAVLTSAAAVLPNGWQVSSTASPSSPAQVFELLEAVTLTGPGWWTTPEMAPTLAGMGYSPINTHPDLILVAGTSSNNELIGTSDGLADQRFSLTNRPLALNPDGSSPLRVRVGGLQWEPVESFVGAESDSQVFRYQIDATGTVEIIFGDGVNGEIPAGAAEIRCDYRYGGGAQGNSVGVSTVKDPLTPIANVDQVFNLVQPSGGADAETIEHAKKYGPLSLRALDRCVTLEDFETMAIATPGGGVKSARAAHLDGPWVVDVFISAEGANPVPSGAWYPDLDTGTGLIGAVGRWLTQRKPVPSELRVAGPTVIRPRVVGQVTCLPNVLRTDVRHEVERNLVTFFRSLTEDFGIGVPMSRIVQIIENSRGVDWFQPDAFHRLPSFRRKRGEEDAFNLALPVVTEIQKTCVYDEYQVRWLNGGVFEIHGKLYGPIRRADGKTASFTVGIEHSISHYPLYKQTTKAEDSPQFKIQITLGAASPQRGDVWTFGVDNYKGNLAIKDYEMVVATISPTNSLDPDEVVLSYGGGIG